MPILFQLCRKLKKNKRYKTECNFQYNRICQKVWVILTLHFKTPLLIWAKINEWEVKNPFELLHSSILIDYECFHPSSRLWNLLAHKHHYKINFSKGMGNNNISSFLKKCQAEKKLVVHQCDTDDMLCSSTLWMIIQMLPVMSSTFFSILFMKPLLTQSIWNHSHEVKP